MGDTRAGHTHLCGLGSVEGEADVDEECVLLSP